MKNKTILLISPEFWGTNFVSKHHYANYLSKNNTVYFLNPVNNSGMNPFGKVNVKLIQLKPNLFQVSYQNLVPKLNSLPKYIQSFIYKRQAKQIQKVLNITNFDVIWSFDPNRFWNQKTWVTKKRIYHTVDFHPHSKFEKEICQSSDIVIGVTPLVINSVKKHVKNIHRIGHGADIDNFSINDEIFIPGENKIKACYTGNFHKHVNYKVLIKLALEHKTIDFILIGPLTDNNLSQGSQLAEESLEKLKRIDNVFMIGSVPSNDLMSYISLCDINLVLFKKEFETIHCSPHKLMAYFYSGNITLSNYIDEHKDTDSDIILMLKDLDEVSNKIKRIQHELQSVNSDEIKLKRKMFALDNSYDNKIEEISKILFKDD